MLRQRISGRQGLDFIKIGGGGDDEFKPGFVGSGEKFQGLRVEAQALGHRGIGELGGDVELIDGLMEIRRGDLGAVGFHFELMFRLVGTEGVDHLQKFGLLEQRFAAGDDGARALVGKDELGGSGGLDLKSDLGFLVFRVAGEGIFFVRPRCFLKIPSVIGIAPNAVEIAARGADENRRNPTRKALTLEGVENFRAIAEFCKFHGRPSEIMDERAWT